MSKIKVAISDNNHDSNWLLLAFTSNQNHQLKIKISVKLGIICILKMISIRYICTDAFLSAY